jgi:hypothetical protein
MSRLANPKTTKINEAPLIDLFLLANSGASIADAE